MLLAELEVYHSRPIAPTRRVALGVTVLPTEPAPGFGGLLLGGIVAQFVDDVDPDLVAELMALTHQVEAGQRIAQPRMRHRLQEDLVGLTRCRHRLLGDGEALRFDLHSAGSPEPNVLGAVYAAGRLPEEPRRKALAAVRRAVTWRGDLGAEFIEYLTGTDVGPSWSALGGTDPVVWALGVLGLPPESAERRSVQGRFRELLRDAHPDHGGDSTDAAQRIRELTEARRILLAG